MPRSITEHVHNLTRTYHWIASHLLHANASDSHEAENTRPLTISFEGAMLCETCSSVFEKAFKYDCVGFFPRLSHHVTFAGLMAAAQGCCYICFNILEQLQDELYDPSTLTMDDDGALFTWEGTSATFGCSAWVSIYLSPMDSQPRPRLKNWSFTAVHASLMEESFDFNFFDTKSNLVVAKHKFYDTVAPTSGSPLVGRLARHWYEHCRDSHASCSRTAVSDKWYPPRMLDVRTTPPRIVLEKDICHGYDFAALSHCWGQKKFLTLTHERLEDFQRNGIALNDLPQNFRDAIVACRGVGIPYLWIDSLCIFQSGDGSYEDWTRHVKSMKRIYAESDLCISTAAAPDATQSCFRERDVRLVEPTVVISGGEPHIVHYSDHALQGFRKLPIASRAWALQERLLSNRILTYGHHQAYYECVECDTKNVCETFPTGIDGICSTRGPFSLPQVPDDASFNLDHYHAWLDSLELYSERQLTRSNDDKFAAFSGIVEHMHKVFSESAYIAGFFAFELPISLLWQVRTAPKSRLTGDHLLYRAPSWSWAATDVPIQCCGHWTSYPYNYTEPITSTARFPLVASLAKYDVQLVDPETPFSQLSYVEITLRASLLPLRWYRRQQSQGLAATTYQLAGTDYDGSHIFSLFHFDSIEDYEEKQDDVFFLPVLVTRSSPDLANSLIVRVASSGRQQQSGSQKEEDVQELRTTYKRIGVANIQDDELYDRLLAVPEQDVVLV
ncbi:HET-domain-containing protein [Decorospora gaudefroyi]|uniref:HET-domain-containing protein n=1 Tax=Decorospora gaudefroyi TaxID=184978 RepID=A0A6A5K3K6_9PLEO|nr:HET-domain-containing protein [Decorospora gaudefroyi]